MKHILKPKTIRAIIPAYGLSEEEIRRTAAGLHFFNSKPLVIVNDDSETLHSDVRNLEEKGFIQAIHIPLQIGKAEAIRRGLREVLKDSDLEIVVQVDGDLKQDIGDVEPLIDYMKKTEAQMVVANRYAYQDLNSQHHRKSIAEILSKSISMITPYEIPDTVCGMRAYDKLLAQIFAKSKSFGYGIEIEQLILAASVNASVSTFEVHSNKQSNFTNVEKIEDNLFALNLHLDALKISDGMKNYAANALVKIKARQSFTLDLSMLGVPLKILLSYNGKQTDDSFSLYSLN